MQTKVHNVDEMDAIIDEMATELHGEDRWLFLTAKLTSTGEVTCRKAQKECPDRMKAEALIQMFLLTANEFGCTDDDMYGRIGEIRGFVERMIRPSRAPMEVGQLKMAAPPKDDLPDNGTLQIQDGNLRTFIPPVAGLPPEEGPESK